MPKTSSRHSKILNDQVSGVSIYNGWAAEKLGPIKLTAWEWGSAFFQWDVDERWLMPDGVMFGGHVASVGDYVTSGTAMTVLTEDDQRFRTSRLETDFFRPMIKQHVMIEGRVVNVSKSLIHVETQFLNPEKKMIARVSAVQVRRSMAGVAVEKAELHP